MFYFLDDPVNLNRQLRVWYIRLGEAGPIVDVRVTRRKLRDVASGLRAGLKVEPNPSAELLAEWDRVAHPTGDTFGGALQNRRVTYE